MKGTIIYYGGFALPDKSASANRVVSNGKLFDSLGYRTVFLGADYENYFDGVKKISENMYQEAHPVSLKDWLESILFFKNLKGLINQNKEVKTIILYNVPFVTLCIAKKRFGKKRISVAYDCTEWTQYTEGSILKRIFKYIDEFFIRNFAHKVADKMIVISSLMEKNYSSHKKLLKLPPMVDITDEIWHQSIEKDENAFTFCFAGFPGGNKESLDKVVEAFKNLDKDNIRLKIVGITLPEFCELYPCTETHGNKNIIFLGKQSHKDTIKNILNCDCYIFIRPSDRRNNAGFPTKFAESFTCGVPIITTNVSDIKDYIAFSDNSVLLENCDVKSIQEAMVSVIKKGENVRTPILKTNFHYEEHINEAKNLFE